MRGVIRSRHPAVPLPVPDNDVVIKRERTHVSVHLVGDGGGVALVRVDVEVMKPNG